MKKVIKIRIESMEYFDKRLPIIDVFHLQKETGISKQKICKYLRDGRLNGFMVGSKGVVYQKWYIECDNTLEQFIKDHHSNSR